MKKTISCLCLFVMLLSCATVCYAAPEIKASSAIMASLSSDQVMYSKNPEEKLPPAEFTKLMTVYTAYKLYGLDTKITVADNINEYTNYMENNMGLKPGEVLKSSDLLYGMILAQANDGAIAVALHHGGIDGFVAKMNENAKALGMADTTFKNPTGRDADGQVTTAKDLLKLYKAFYADKKLYEIISTINVEISATNLSDSRTYWTKNHLMSRFVYLDYIYPYAKAGVSSSSSYGGYSVISSAQKGEREYVCVVLDSDYENGVIYSMTDAQSLFEHGFNDFSSTEVSKKGALLYEAKLVNQKGKETLLLCASKTLKAQILDSDTVDSVEKEIVIEEPVKAPVKKGDPVGKIVYTYNGNLVGEIELLAENDVKRSVIKTIFSGIMWFISLPVVKGILALVVVLILIMFISSYFKNKNRKKRNRRNRRNRYYRGF